jgi:Tfp pilus assembly protein PilV
LALLIVLIALGLASALGMSLLKLTMAQRQQAEQAGFHAQARWLAESAVNEAAARLKTDPKFAGRDWMVSAKELGGRHAANVSIEVKPVENSPQRRQVTVIADMPAESEQRARVRVVRFVDL